MTQSQDQRSPCDGPEKPGLSEFELFRMLLTNMINLNHPLVKVASHLGFVIEVIRRSDDQKGFKVLPRRWVVERTFGWMIRWRRLVRDYEQRIDVSQAMILVAMGGNMLRRNAHP
jgi:hypothetical protein